MYRSNIYTNTFKKKPPLPLHQSHLDVGVAKRSTHGAHGVSNSNVLRVSIAKRHCVGELSLGCGRCCDDGSSVNSIGALGRVHVLPGPPNTVDLTVVEVEPWITCSWLADGTEMRSKTAVSGDAYQER